MRLVLLNKIALEIRVSHPRPTLLVRFGQLSAHVCLEDPAPPGTRLPFYEHRKWHADSAIERQWWIGALAASLSTPLRAGTELAKELTDHGVRYEVDANGAAAGLVKTPAS